MARLPGMTVKHTIITPTCRRNRGVNGAFEEAVRRLREEYEQLEKVWGDKGNFHVALTVERIFEDS